MGVLATDKRQLSYIYSSESDLGKKMLGYVDSIDKGIKSTDISRDNFGDTIWTEIIEMIGMSFKELLSTDHPSVPDAVKDGDYDINGWLQILDKNPILLQDPIAINGNRAKVIRSRADILTFYGVDSAGLKENSQSGEPDTTRQTEGETFVPDND